MIHQQKPLLRCQDLRVLMSTNSEILPTEVALTRRTTKNEGKRCFINGCHTFSLDNKIREDSGNRALNAFCVVFIQSFRWTADKLSSVSSLTCSSMTWCYWTAKSLTHPHPGSRWKALPNETLDKWNSSQNLLAEWQQHHELLHTIPTLRFAPVSKIFIFRYWDRRKTSHSFRASRIPRGNFFLAVFFCVTSDGETIFVRWFSIRILLFRPRLNILIFLLVLGWKYSCEYS